jgi:hypothetical protein
MDKNHIGEQPLAQLDEHNIDNFGSINKQHYNPPRVISDIAISATKTIEQLSQAASNTLGAIGERTQQIKHAGPKLTESLRSKIRSNPIASQGIAVAAGFLLSWVISRFE